jgi:peptide-methionine (R)-S-oxide reductase
MNQLTDKQKYVILHDGTEEPFKNEYWDNKEAGIYVDATSGEPLFSSTDKYDCGTGGPSFTQPIDDNFVTKLEDNKLFMKRTEVRSKNGDSHLGHLFDDGPKEAGGKRYCINSASMNFVPFAELANKGYDEYLTLFEE